MFSGEKTARFLNRSLVLIPSEYEQHDANHVAIVFFAVLGLSLLGKPLPAGLEEYVDNLFVGNGYKGSMSYLDEPHLPSTYFCLAIRRILGLRPLTEVQRTQIEDYIEKCQTSSGLFRARAGNGDASVRHNYTAHAVNALLRTESTNVDHEKAWVQRSLSYMRGCQNYEGAMGDSLEQEAHLGLTYCSVASLVMHGSGPEDTAKLLRFVIKRLAANNGRPNKPADVCYTFWALGTAHCLNAKFEGDAEFLVTDGYDDLLGGFRKTKDAHADPYHTALALCALSLIDHKKFGLKELDPVLCVPK